MIRTNLTTEARREDRKYRAKPDAKNSSKAHASQGALTSCDLIRREIGFPDPGCIGGDRQGDFLTRALSGNRFWAKRLSCVVEQIRTRYRKGRQVL